LTELTAVSAPLLSLLVASLAVDWALLLAFLPADLPVDFARELAFLLRLAALEPLLPLPLLRLAALEPLLPLLLLRLAALEPVLLPPLLRLAALEPLLPLLLRLALALLELPLRPRVAARVVPDPEEPFEDEPPWDDARREDPLRVVAAISLSLRLGRAHRVRFGCKGRALRVGYPTLSGLHVN
jgi:hypothetical protein